MGGFAAALELINLEDYGDRFLDWKVGRILLALELYQAPLFGILFVHVHSPRY